MARSGRVAFWRTVLCATAGYLCYRLFREIQAGFKPISILYLTVQGTAFALGFAGLSRLYDAAKRK
jgi:hypothetical protein